MRIGFHFKGIGEYRIVILDEDMAFHTHNYEDA